MILIVGGINQGRLGFVLKHFGLDKTDVFDCSKENFTGKTEKKVIYNIDELIKTVDFDSFLCLYRDVLCDKIIITAETGCGLVPVDKAERELREKNGRANCALAENAQSVYRVVCGIGQRIK